MIVDVSICVCWIETAIHAFEVCVVTGAGM